MSRCHDHFVENLKEFRKKTLLELVNGYSNVAGCKVNIQLALKKVTYLGINLTNYAQNLTNSW